MKFFDSEKFLLYIIMNVLMISGGAGRGHAQAGGGHGQQLRVVVRTPPTPSAHPSTPGAHPSALGALQPRPGLQ